MADYGTYLLKALLRFGIDKDSADKTAKGVKSVEEGLKELEKAADATRKKMEKMRQTAEQLTRIGTIMGAAGGVVMYGAIRSAQTFATAAGQSDAVARKWLSTTKELEQAQLRLGRSAASALSGGQGLLAGAANAAARIAEKHPGTVGTALGLAGAVGGVGGIAAMAGTGIRLYADVKLLAASAIQAKAAQTMLTAAGIQAGAAGTAGKGLAAGGIATVAGGIAAAVLGGLSVGLAGNELARNALGPKSGLASFGQIASVGAYGVGNALGGDLMGKQWFTQVATWTGAIDDAGAAAADAALRVQEMRDQVENGVIPEGSLNAYKAFLDEQKAADAANEEARLQIENEYGQERVRLEGEYEAARAQLLAESRLTEKRALEDYLRAVGQQREDMAKAESDASAAYAQQRADTARTYNLQLGQIESAYRRSMAALERDHTATMEEAAARFDVYALVQEQRRYDAAKTDAQQQHDEQVAENRRAYEQAMADLRSNYEAQKAQRLADGEEKLADLTAQYELEKGRRAEDDALKLAEMDNQHQKEMTQLRTQNEERKATLAAQYTRETNQRKTALDEQMKAMLGVESVGMAAITADFKNYLLKMQQSIPGNTAPAPQKAAGGYAPFGMYMAGEQGEEFVLSHGTTRAAERLMGGRLSQRRVLNGLTGGGGITVNLEMGAGRLSLSERRSILAESRAGVLAELDRALRMAA